MQIRDRRGQYKTRGVIYKPARIDEATGLRMTHGNGCCLHDNCLTCPREMCIYDEPNPRRKYELE